MNRTMQTEVLRLAVVAALFPMLPTIIAISILEKVVASHLKAGKKIYLPIENWEWAVHNIVAHPLSEVLHQFGFKNLSNQLHDVTIPPHEEGTGRG